MKVLLVEDYPDTADMLSRAWRQDGCEVVTAVDGADALSEIARAIKTKPFDLLVVDIAMPFVDGTSLIKAIHCLEASGVLKTQAHILIYTGHQNLYEQMQDIKNSRIKESDCYLKPQDSIRLLDDVKQRIGIGEGVNYPKDSNEISNIP